MMWDSRPYQRRIDLDLKLTTAGASRKQPLRDGLTCTGVSVGRRGQLVTVAMRCSDGRTGIALVTHQDAFNGGGTVRFSDGTEGTFVFGEGATTI